MDRSLISLFLVPIIALSAQAQDLEPVWGGAFGGSGVDVGYDVALDADGHVYVVGIFEGTVDLDPGPGVSTLTSAGGSDVFVSKFDTSGTLLWAKAFGGIHDDGSAATVAVDDAGNVYITGGFMGTADFDPGPGSSTLTAATTAQTDIFISKLDPNGNFVWVKGIVGGTWWDNSYDIAIDPSGNVVVVGRFYYQGGPRDFDPGPGTYFLTAGHEDIFVLKLTSAGDFVWAVAFGTAPDESRGYSLALDADGNIFTTGYFRGTVDFDPDTANTYDLSAPGTWNVFFHKMDADAHFLWARALPITTATYYNDGSYGSKITLDPQGNLYATGRFSGTIDFDPGAGTWPLTAVGDNDVYLTKFTPGGGLVWARSFGGPGYDEGVCVNAVNGGLFLSGIFASTADLDPGPAVLSHTSAGDADAFLLKLDTAGVLIHAASMGGGGSDRAHAMKTSGSGALYVTGWFTGTTDLDPGNGTVSAASAGNFDGFLLKLHEADVTAIDESSSGQEDMILYPVPARDRITVLLQEGLIGERGVIQVVDATGKCVRNEPVPSFGTDLTIELPPGSAEGMYQVVITTAGSTLRQARFLLLR